MKTLHVTWFLLPLISFFDLAATATWYTASDGHSYLIEGSSTHNWLQALNQCSRRDLQLAVIDSWEKNEALIELLRNIFGKSPDLWLGHHDEFNRKKDKNRLWYSSASGLLIDFAYWDNGKPNNKGGDEHCTYISRKANFKWNDEHCDTLYIGYICEEHNFNMKNRQELKEKRLATIDKNEKLCNEFKNTQEEILEINKNTSGRTDQLLEESQESVGKEFKEFKKSFMDLLKKRPYMEAVIADIGKAVDELAKKTEEKILEISGETRRNVEEIHNKAEITLNGVTEEFAEELINNKNEINTLLTKRI